MVDKYDYELPELNEERTCDNPPESKDSKMTDTYDNVYDPAIMEPGREVEYNYSTGVGSEEDETAATRVEMTANPSYETANCSKECVSIVNNQISKTLMNLLNFSYNLISESSLTDPKNTDIHTYAYVCDHKEASMETECAHSTCQGSEEDEIAATRVETMAITLTPGYGTVISSKEHVHTNNHEYITPIKFFAQSQQLLIWWMSMTVNCLNSMKRGHMAIFKSRQILK